MGFVIDGTKRMQRLIRTILDYSKAGHQGLKGEPVESATVAHMAVANLKRKIAFAKASVEFGSLPTIVADPALLTQLLQNLVSNAIKFKDKNRPAMIKITASEAQQEWAFSVADNGIGISPVDTKRTFKLFQRLHSAAEYPRTGSGLAMCRRIIDRHHGRLWVESMADVGSTFLFSLPKP